MFLFQNERMNALRQRRTGIHPVADVTISRGSFYGKFKPTSAKVTMDRRRAHLTTATIGLEVDDNLPDLEVLNPFGTEVDVRMGYRLPDGTEELVPMGTRMQITSARGAYTKGSTLTIDASDYGDVAARRKWREPFLVSPNDAARIIEIALRDRGMSLNLGTWGSATARVYTFGLETSLDPWGECRRVAEEHGARLWVERTGAVVLDKTPNASNTPRPLLLLNSDMAMSTRPPSVVVARYEPSDGVPVTGVAVDDDGSSLTNINGPYGEVVEFWGPVNVEVSQVTANQNAQAILDAARWRGASWSFEVGFDPTIDTDDTITVTPRNSAVIGMVDAVTHSLSSSQFRSSLTVRQQL